MPNPNKEVSFVIDTIEDLRWNSNINAFFSYLETLLISGFDLVFYRVGNDERLTTIQDIDHFKNFKRSFRNPEII